MWKTWLRFTDEGSEGEWRDVMTNRIINFDSIPWRIVSEPTGFIAENCSGIWLRSFHMIWQIFMSRIGKCGWWLPLGIWHWLCPEDGPSLSGYSGLFQVEGSLSWLRLGQALQAGTAKSKWPEDVLWSIRLEAGMGGRGQVLEDLQWQVAWPLCQCDSDQVPSGHQHLESIRRRRM